MCHCGAGPRPAKVSRLSRCGSLKAPPRSDLLGLFSAEITFAAPGDNLARLRWIFPPIHLRFLAFQFLVNTEEVLNLSPHVRKDLIHCMDLIIARVASRHGHDLLIGLVDESDVLAALLAERDDPNRAFARPVAEVMATRLETISADAPIADLLPLFRKDYVAIVMDGDQFLGVATRLDLINYFRIAL